MIVYCASLCCFDRSDLTEAGPMFLEDTYILLLDACILLKVFCCHCLKKTTKLLNICLLVYKKDILYTSDAGTEGARGATAPLLPQ